jgi:hypothetical protein
VLAGWIMLNYLTGMNCQGNGQCTDADRTDQQQLINLMLFI